MNADEKLARQAFEYGAAARRAGKPESACPYRGDTFTLRTCRDHWRRGWQEQGMKRKAEARK